MEQAIIDIKNELYNKVDKVHLSSILSTHKLPKGKEYAIVDWDNNTLLSFCSKDYKLRKNSIIYIEFEKALKKKNIKFKKESIVIDGTKFYINYILLSPVESDLIPDLLPVVNIWNSYDGTIKTQIHFGYRKLLCGNNLTRPTDCDFKTSSKHSASDEEFTKYNIPHFVDMCLQFLKCIKKDIKIFEKLHAIPAAKKFLDTISSKLKLHSNARDLAISQLQKEIDGNYHYLNHKEEQVFYKGCKMTMFSIYNAINYAIYHTNHKELPENKYKRNNKLMELIVKTNIK